MDFNKFLSFPSTMPLAGNSWATQVDNLYYFIIYSSVVSGFLILGAVVYFSIKYRRKDSSRDNLKEGFPHSLWVEIAWTLIPAVFFIGLFFWGSYVYYKMNQVQKNALEIHVVGQKWSWDFLYKSGKSVSNEFQVPLGRPIKLIMTSRDVIHSFFLPGFRIKKDLIPGRYTVLRFTPEVEGVYQVFCAEYCGTAHSSMLAKMKVVSEAEYELWLEHNSYKELNLSQVGEKIFASKCAVCHKVDKTRSIGPGLKGLWGAKKELVDGSKVSANEQYIRDSILKPAYQVVKGYPAAMPSFAGQISEEELLSLIEYIKGL